MHVPLAKKEGTVELCADKFWFCFVLPGSFRAPRFGGPHVRFRDRIICKKMSYIDTYVHACSLAHFPPTPSSHPHHMDPWPDSPRERERRWPPPPPWPLLSWLCPVVKTSRWLSLSFVWWLRGGLRWVGRLRDRSVDRWIDTRQTN